MTFFRRLSDALFLIAALPLVLFGVLDTLDRGWDWMMDPLQ